MQKQTLLCPSQLRYHFYEVNSFFYSFLIVFLKLSRRFGFSTRSLGHVISLLSWEAESSWKFQKHDPKWVKNPFTSIWILDAIISFANTFYGLPVDCWPNNNKTLICFEISTQLLATCKDLPDNLLLVCSPSSSRLPGVVLWLWWHLRSIQILQGSVHHNSIWICSVSLFLGGIYWQCCSRFFLIKVNPSLWYLDHTSPFLRLVLLKPV